MKDALLRLFSSMKFWTTIAALLATLGAKYGFSVDQTTVLMIGTLFAILLGAQGLTDMGKGRATVQAEAGAAQLATTLAAPANTNVINAAKGTTITLVSAETEGKSS